MGGGVVFMVVKQIMIQTKEKRKKQGREIFVHRFPKDETDNEKWKNAIPVFNANLSVKK